MKRIFFNLIITLIIGIAFAQSDDKSKEGITLKAAIGYGYTGLEYHKSISGIGVNIGAGGYVNNAFAVLGELTINTDVFKENKGIKYLGYVGPIVQYWFNNKIFFSGGIGVCRYTHEINISKNYYQPEYQEETSTDYLINADIGYVFYKSYIHNIGIQVCVAALIKNMVEERSGQISIFWQIK